MRMILALGFSVLALSGCAEIAAKTEAQQDGQCRSYGFVPGTDGYANCRMRVAEMFQRQMQMNAAIMMQGAEANQRALANVVQPLPVSPRINCVTNYIGQQAYTNCH